MRKANFFKYLFPVFSILILSFPAISLAVICDGAENNLNLCYPSFGLEGEKITLSLGTKLHEMVAWFYYFIIGIAGLSAFVMLVWGGFQYLSSAGNPAAIGDAKDKMKSALLGLLIILTAWLVLQVINPDLIILKEI